MPSCLWLGIDPGLTGAIAVIDGDEIEIPRLPRFSPPASGTSSTRREGRSCCGRLRRTASQGR